MSDAKFTIDPANGTVLFPGSVTPINSLLSEKRFLASDLAHGADILSRNDPFRSYRLVSITAFGSHFSVVLSFKSSQLISLSLVDADLKFGRNWTEWSEQSELNRKARHDEILKMKLGVQPGSFPWGTLLSEFDSKSGSATISLHYSW